MQRIIKRKVILPEKALKEKFIDKSGKYWIFDTKINGFFPKIKTFLKEDGSLQDHALDELQKSCKPETQKWYAEYKKGIYPVIGQFIEEFSKSFDFAFESGERDFRKEYTKMLAIKGKAIFAQLFAEFLEKCSQELLNCVEMEGDNNKPNSFIISLGPFPPTTRFYWKLERKKELYELFCFEFQPSKRTINIKGENKSYNLAFPWLCVFTAFKNGKFYSFENIHEHDHCAFWIFYRQDALKYPNDELFMPNLPNIFRDWPYFICLGSSLPVIKLSDPKWHAKLFNYFWNSDFDNNDNARRWSFYNDVVKSVPEIDNWQKWEDVSKKNPNRVLELPWPKLGQTIEVFAEKVLELMTKEKDIEKEQKQYKIEKMKSEINGLIKKFSERLSEELYFLGASLVIPIKSKEKLQNYVAKTADVLKTELETRIDQLLSKVAETTTENIKNLIAIKE